jgi:basic amino acid/polyamine antiporter, APA family
MNLGDYFRTKSVERIQADAAGGFSDHEHSGGKELRRTLGLTDLTLMGIAAIIGAGVFAMIGKASYNGGPAVIFLFVFTAIACAFSALCYAEFASRIPVAGSAYTYSYASFGELVAWIIGWDLIVEYAIGNIAVAISWSDYFTGLLEGYGLKVPSYFTMDFLTAQRGFAAVTDAMKDGTTLQALTEAAKLPDAKINAAQIDAYTAWATAPQFGGLHLVCDLPALLITLVITALVYIGIRESKLASNVMTVLKIGIILLVITLGAFYVSPANWSPFAPNGIGGVLMGVSAVFFAYIGFDALSTTAEECNNPRRDLPYAMIFSLVICTVLYIALALVLTGMVPYTKLNVGDPLAFVFGAEGANIQWIAGIIAISAVIALATVFLVFQIGQPRLWMAMSRDGLLPKVFSRIHPRFQTPSFATVLTGFVVAIPALFMNLTEVTDLASIGTLFAFTLVCGGVLVKDKDFGRENRFVPYINGRYFVPLIFIIFWTALYFAAPEFFANFFTVQQKPDETFLSAISHKIPSWTFILVFALLTIYSVIRQLTLIPVLGVLCCTYLMSELGITNWTRFAVWLLVGLAIYFSYGYTHSNIGQEAGRDSKSNASLKMAAIGFVVAAIGLSVSSFSFINDFILYILPALDAATLKYAEIALFLIGLIVGIVGAFGVINRGEAAK